MDFGWQCARPVLEEPAPASLGVIIPARALSELSRIIGVAELGEEEGVDVTVTEARNQVMFHLPGVDLVSQLIEANYPDYNKIVPTTYNTRTVVNTTEFLKAAKVAHLFARDSANIVRLAITPGDPGKILLSSTSPELGDNEAEVEAAVEGEAIEAAFNAKFMIDVLVGD